MKLFTSITFIFISISKSFAMVPKTPTVKIAVLDTLVWERLATEKYADNYTRGLSMAAEKLSKNGIAIEYKKFQYDKKPLAIFEQTKQIREWNPHFVIGPRFSELFLLLQDQFDGLLVVSPLATANEVYRMPKNFYSMSPPNGQSAKALAKVALLYFKGQTIHPIIEIDCKYCVDYGQQFVIHGKQFGISFTNQSKTYLSNNVDTLDISSLLPNKSTKVFFLPNRSFTSGKLMAKISNQLQTQNLVFLGADGWGNWDTSYTGKFPTPYPYQAYRVTPWTFESDEPWAKQFRHQHSDQYPSQPPSNTTMMTYHTVLAILETLPKDTIEITAELILKSFQEKVKSEPNYGRPKTYGVYQLSQNGEKLHQTIDIE